MPILCQIRLTFIGRSNFLAQIVCSRRFKTLGLFRKTDSDCMITFLGLLENLFDLILIRDFLFL